MCSVNDSEIDGSGLIPITDKFNAKNKTCRKCCSKPSSVVLQRKDAYCRDCFLETATHKFRSTLGKSKMMKPRDKVLVGFSGSQSSTALVHMLQTGFAADCHKRLHFEVVLLYIDEDTLLNQSYYSKEETAEAIKTIMNLSGFKGYITTLSQSLADCPEVVSSDLKKNEALEKQLMELFGSVTSLSAKGDLLMRLKQRLIAGAAKVLGCNKIFTAEIGSDLAVKLLTGVSTGRGAQLPLEVGFCDFRHRDVKLLRPLKDFTKKEIAFYNVFNGLRPVFRPSLSTMSPPGETLQGLTESFVTGLQEGFPSTVYTIFRTGDKFNLDGSALGAEDRLCVLCGGNMATGSAAYDAVESTEYSRSVARGGEAPGSCGAHKGGCCGGSGGCGGCGTDPATTVSREDLEKCLCYGCGLIARDMETLDKLPKDMLLAAGRRRDFDAMREHISEFLIT